MSKIVVVDASYAALQLIESSLKAAHHTADLLSRADKAETNVLRKYRIDPVVPFKSEDLPQAVTLALG